MKKYKNTIGCACKRKHSRSTMEPVCSDIRPNFGARRKKQKGGEGGSLSPSLFGRFYPLPRSDIDQRGGWEMDGCAGVRSGGNCDVMALCLLLLLLCSRHLRLSLCIHLLDVAVESILRAMQVESVVERILAIESKLGTPGTQQQRQKAERRVASGRSGPSASHPAVSVFSHRVTEQAHVCLFVCLLCH